MSEELNKDELIALLKQVVIEVVESHPLSPEEVQWVRMAIKAEADRAAFRKAVIDKSLQALIVTALGALGVWFIDWFQSHWISK